MKLRNLYKREYRIWKALRARCNAPCYSNSTYQKKGIKCCRRWQSFEHFISDMGKCPEGYSIDRIDNNKGYEPDNCRWADNNTQAKNRGNFTPTFSYKGENHILKDWSKILNINYSTLRKRIFEMGMTFEAAVTYIDPRDELIWYEGKHYTRKELCNLYNIPLQNFYDRQHKGWGLTKILNTPIRKRSNT